MPHANIWIRKENEDKWEAIPEKSEWINALLANSGSTSRYGAPRTIAGETFREVLSETLPKQPVLKPRVSNTAGYCKEGHPIPPGRDRCMGKGCKYS
jgi:hypothetical protein